VLIKVFLGVLVVLINIATNAQRSDNSYFRTFNQFSGAVAFLSKGDRDAALGLTKNSKDGYSLTLG